MGRRQRGDHGQALHRLAGEPAHGVTDRLAVDGVDGHYGDEVTVLLGGQLEAVQRGHGAVKACVHGYDAQRLGPPAGQGSSGDVGPVAKLVDGGQHPGPGELAHTGVVVEDPRHGLMGDSGDGGDVGNRGPALGLPVWFGGLVCFGRPGPVRAASASGQGVPIRVESGVSARQRSPRARAPPRWERSHLSLHALHPKLRDVSVPKQSDGEDLRRKRGVLSPIG